MRRLRRPGTSDANGAGAPSAGSLAVDGAGVSFLLRDGRDSLKDRLIRRRAQVETFHALADVDLHAAPGETIGIIGRNGSGKSTLLKLLAGILLPDTGTVQTAGRVAALLELGAGFHGELTGRENVHLNAALLGVPPALVEERFDEIVAFAGVERFIDTAVRTWSSGMYVRLGFSVAALLEPDVLLVDEVLSVGDVDFQRRSLARMQQIAASGTTVVVVSHDLATVESFCDRVLVLDAGRVVADGPADTTVARYLTQFPEEAAAGGMPATGNGAVTILSVDTADDLWDPIDPMDPSTYVHLVVRLRAERPLDAVSVGFRVATHDGLPLHEMHTTWQGVGIGPLVPGDEAEIDFRMTAHLLAGHYPVDVVVTDPDVAMFYAVERPATTFSIRAQPGSIGIVDLQSAAVVREGTVSLLDVGQTRGAASARPTQMVD